MAFTQLSDDRNIIQALDDEPNDVGGLSAQELKAKFDEAGNTIKTYLNDTFLAELGGITWREKNLPDILVGIDFKDSDFQVQVMPWEYKDINYEY